MEVEEIVDTQWYCLLINSILHLFKKKSEQPNKLSKQLILQLMAGFWYNQHYMTNKSTNEISLEWRTFSPIITVHWKRWRDIWKVHPGRLTWNLQITHLERKMIFQTIIFRFHVNLPGCIWKVTIPLEIKRHFSLNPFQPQIGELPELPDSTGKPSWIAFLHLLTPVATRLS